MIRFSFFRKRKFSFSKTINVELPSDFDPNIYLNLHPDVAKSNIDPFEHYIKYGANEGRRYKPQRKVYIDIGASNGLTVEQFCDNNSDFEIFAFEPSPRLANGLRSKFLSAPRITIIEAAAWISDGTAKFYSGTISDESSNLSIDKKEEAPWGDDYENGIEVHTIDFANWMIANTSDNDLVVVKMDIEGAEYKIIPRMIELHIPERLSEIRVEWHWDRYPIEVTENQHHQIRNSLKSLVRVIDWN
ncbi:FkbM family methyltransferase [Ochrobactrum sp. Kaboul]|nr:FkbM family methyltransferase [Ochrobactrum sp. Kaboul]